MKKDEELLFKNLMHDSELKMPFLDFEDDIMMQINKQQLQKKGILRNLKLSWLFFIAGTVFGVIISLLLPSLESTIPGVSTENISIVFQVFFVLFVMLQLESLLTDTKRARKAAKFQ